MLAPRVILGVLLALGFAVSAAPPEPPAEESCSKARLFAAEAEMASLDPHDDPLASDWDVEHVRLELEIEPTAQRLRGTCRTTARALRDGAGAFRFRLASRLTILSLTVDGARRSFTRPEEPIVEVAAPARNAGAALDLVVVYEGVPVASGITFRSTTSGPVVATLSEPYFASNWWPTKDDNRDKFTADLLFTVPEGLTVVSNGVLVGSEPQPGGRRRFHWRSGYPIAPYLVSFAASVYNRHAFSFAHDGGAMPLDLYLYPSSDTPANRAAWQRSLDMLRAFGARFGPYPFIDEKYAIYQFPFGGGMEHQTATGQGGTGAFRESLTAHELAHQWWGDMITCATWHDIWLNEGFATYAEALWEEHNGGPAALATAMLARRPGNPAGRVWVEDTSDPARVFARDTTYLKAGWVVHMLRGLLGDERFFELLAVYRERFAFASASTADLAALAAEIAGRDLGWFFDQWIFAAGAPQYRWGWQATRAAGRSYLELYVEQVQQPDWPTFSAPLHFSVDGRVLEVWNDARRQHFLLPQSEAPAQVGLDIAARLLFEGVDETSFVDGPPRVVAVQPPPGSRLRGRQPRITVSFHEDVRIGAEDVLLVGADGLRVPVAVAYDPQGQTAVISATQPLPYGPCTLSVTDGVTDRAGVALDGEGASDLPSGDGRPGGDAVIRFIISDMPRLRLRS